ncbi:MAG: hypothetical protein BWK78_02760 [Thiotrichaceae bacterium IS1]|nr:MAG: hypothetical protein BWK78_02760 [Thiotrichaceae bacterium IS1]
MQHNENIPSGLTRTITLWEKLRGENLFITGGTGLFGHWFLENLVEANQFGNLDIRATVLTRNPIAFQQKAPELLLNTGIQLHSGDITNFEFPKGEYSQILHLATTSAIESFQGEEQLRKFHTLVNGTERVLQFAGYCGVKKVLFTSSGVAYGILPEGMQLISEDYCGAPDTTQPNSALGQAKRTAEYLCAYYADKYDFDYTIARCFSFVGPRLPLNLHYAIGNFIRDALWADAITVKGDGTPVRSFLYMADLVVWLLTLLVKGQSSRIYNVGSDQPITIRDLAYLIREILCQDKPVQILGDTTHNIGHFARNWYVPNIHRARTELQLEVWTSLDEAIRKTAEAALLQEQKQ